MKLALCKNLHRAHGKGELAWALPQTSGVKEQKHVTVFPKAFKTALCTSHFFDYFTLVQLTRIWYVLNANKYISFLFQDAGVSPEKAATGPNGENKKLNKTQQLKQVFKEYGAVGVSFHVGISLVSLGIFYLVVSR